VRNLNVETLEIEHFYGGESLWKDYNSKLLGNMSLDEFPENLAKRVLLHPPSFKDALERYWLRSAEGQSDTDK